MLERKGKYKIMFWVGSFLACFMISVLIYVIWKSLFYYDAAVTGAKLTKGLISELLLDSDEFFNPDYFSKKKMNFLKFDYYPKGVVASLDKQFNPSLIKCDAKTDIHSTLTYSAVVTCYLGTQEIHYMFKKNYGHPQLLLLISFFLLPSIYGIFYFFHYVEKLQMLNLGREIELAKEKLVIEIGARLVHDLKKGIMAQLNQLYQEYGQDIEMAMLQPDFADRFQKKLRSHFQHIDFLNSYINLLMTNLKREKEGCWIAASRDKLKEYLSNIFQIKKLNEIVDAHNDNQIFFYYNPQQSIAELKFSPMFSDFLVPEMSFFRILKNVSENFNTYGKNYFQIEVIQNIESNQVRIIAKNEINAGIGDPKESTNLGHIIIKQLLQDNFGEASGMIVSKQRDQYQVEIYFPMIPC